MTISLPPILCFPVVSYYRIKIEIPVVSLPFAWYTVKEITINQRSYDQIMDLFDEIELFDCPQCHGPGLIQEENGWCLYVECLDCGCHTAELPFKNADERQTVAKQAASLWNIGKVIASGVGE